MARSFVIKPSHGSIQASGCWPGGSLSVMKARILEEVQHLPVEQRIELAEAIWDTIAEDADVAALPVPEAHRAELDRRLADWTADPDAGSSWEEVRGRLERRE